MKLLITFLFLLLAAHSTAEENAKLDPPLCAYGTPSTDLPKAFQQFEFLIGDYTVNSFGWFNNQWYPNPNQPVPARWNGYYGLKGKTIVDEWFNEDPGVSPATGRGVNVRMYDPASEEWKMMWISDFNHVVQELRAKVIDGKLTMWQVHPERPDFRAEFEVIDQDTWQRIEYQKDGDGIWQKRFVLKATRIPC